VTIIDTSQNTHLVKPTRMPRMEHSNLTSQHRLLPTESSRPLTPSDSAWPWISQFSIMRYSMTPPKHAALPNR
jgi:hypothetical protein